MEKSGVVEVDPGPDPDGSVIWLHGLGADGHDFEPIVPELDLDGEVQPFFQRRQRSLLDRKRYQILRTRQT